MRTMWRESGFGVLALAITHLTPAAQVTERQVQAALGLLPADARAGAEILIEKEESFIVQRAGSNDWSCRVRIVSERLVANCHHRVLAGKIDLEQELAAGGLPGKDVREQLAVRLRSGHLSIPPGSVEISGSGPLSNGGGVPKAMRGYYFVYFPFATSRTLGLPNADPGGGAPWLHHEGMADAHIMWPHSHTPVAGR